MILLKKYAFLIFVIIPFIIINYANTGMILVMYSLYLLGNVLLIIALKPWNNISYTVLFRNYLNKVFALTSITFLAGYLFANLQLYI